MSNDHGGVFRAFREARDVYVEWSLRAGAAVLLAYAAAGALVGFELFAFIAVWPVGITTLIMSSSAASW